MNPIHFLFLSMVIFVGLNVEVVKCADDELVSSILPTVLESEEVSQQQSDVPTIKSISPVNNNTEYDDDADDADAADGVNDDDDNVESTTTTVIASDVDPTTSTATTTTTTTINLTKITESSTRKPKVRRRFRPRKSTITTTTPMPTITMSIPLPVTERITPKADKLVGDIDDARFKAESADITSKKNVSNFSTIIVQILNVCNSSACVKAECESKFKDHEPSRSKCLTIVMKESTFAKTYALWLETLSDPDTLAWYHYLFGVITCLGVTIKVWICVRFRKCIKSKLCCNEWSCCRRKKERVVHKKKTYTPIVRHEVNELESIYA